MKFLDFLGDNTIIVCNYSYQKEILKEINKRDKLYNIKFFSMNEFINHYYFSYDEKTISYIMKEYNCSYNMANIYLSNLIYIKNDSKIGNIHFLYQLKNELLDNNLLYFDDGFKKYISKFDILFVGFPYFKLFEEKMIEEVKIITNCSIVDCEGSNDVKEVYEFSYIDDEVSFVCDKISELINNGVDINKIKLANVDKSYYSSIDKIFDLYNIPINISKHYLYGLGISSYFLDIYDQYDLDKCILMLNEKYPNDKDIITLIVNIINRYVLVEDKGIKKKFIINDFKNTNIVSKYVDAVKVINYLNDYVCSDDYVFFLNFNQNNVFNAVKDEGFITDRMKDGLDIDLVVSLNKNIKKAVINKIKSLPNLVISYKLKDSFDNFTPSNIIDELGLTVKTYEGSNISYSARWNRVVLAKLLYNFINYGVIDKRLPLLYYNYPIEYLTYNNQFKGIDKDIFKKYYGDEIRLSYSSMNDYYNCKFKYYLNHVLKLNIYEETFAANIGSLFHYVLASHFKEGKDVDDLLKEYISLHPLRDKKEEFFVDKLKDDLYFAVDTIHEQMKLCELNNACYEEKESISISGNLKITFIGFIDKLLYLEEDGKTYVAIIDYKTGNTAIDISLLLHGLSMQLPVYMFLASKDNKFKDVSFAGIYLQKILTEIPNIDKKKSYDEIREDNLKLNGYSNDDFSIISRFDHSFKDSRVIRGLKLTKDGNFYSNSKVLSNYQFDRIVSIVNDKILEAGDGILNAKFKIDPKEVDDKVLGCMFCPFKDICFRSNQDIVEIEKDKSLSFLGGENND